MSDPIDVFNAASAETIAFFANLLIYYKVLLGNFPDWVPAGYLPLLLCIYMVYKMIFPLRTTREFWKVIASVLCAPFVKVEFFATYMADVMSSTVKTYQDIVWSFCFFCSGDFLLTPHEFRHLGNTWQKSYLYMDWIIPTLCVAPLWLRFQQCLRRFYDTQKRFPNLANALKYVMAFTVSLFGLFTPKYAQSTAVQVVWLTMYVVSTLFTFFWDVLQDWGLGDPAHGYLHKRRLFHKSMVYYAAVVIDFVLRFNWLYSLIPPGHLPLLPNWTKSTVPVFMTTFVIVCEVLRRTMWGFFRLENEHLNNTQGFFRSSELVPLHFTTETQPSETHRNRGLAALGEVIAVGAVGVVMAALAVIAAREQEERPGT
ncbi:unnamed protein product [Discosporangium mesarthrocarpum]